MIRFRKGDRVQLMETPDWYDSLTGNQREERIRTLRARGEDWRHATGQFGTVVKTKPRQYVVEVLMDGESRSIDIDLWQLRKAPA